MISFHSKGLTVHSSTTDDGQGVEMQPDWSKLSMPSTRRRTVQTVMPEWGLESGDSGATVSHVVVVFSALGVTPEKEELRDVKGKLIWGS